MPVAAAQIRADDLPELTDRLSISCIVSQSGTAPARQGEEGCLREHAHAQLEPPFCANAEDALAVVRRMLEATDSIGTSPYQG